MKKLAALMLLFCCQQSMAKEDTLSYGVGVGTMYSGLGGNISLTSETDKKYLSAGCISYGSTSGAICGAGAGWINTEIIDASSNKHGLGIYLGIVDTKYGGRKAKAAYGIATGYHYFFNGINKPGAHLGLSIGYSNKNDHHDNNTSLMLELGYQF